MDLPRWLNHQKHYAERYLSYSVGLGLASGLLLIVQAWLLARVIDGVIFQQRVLEQLTPWLIAMLGIFLLRSLLTWASEQTAFRAAARVKLALRKRLYRHLQQLGPIYLSGERSGELVNTLSDGVEALEAYYARYIPAISLMTLVPLSILVVVLPVDWLSALVMLITAPLIPFFMILIGKGAERRNQRQWRRLARMSAHFLDMIQGLTSLKLFNASRREARVIARISDDYRRSTMSVLRVAFLSSFALEFFSTVSIAVVAVLIGFRLYWGEMAFYQGFFVLLLAPEFYLPLRNMGTHYHARMEGIGAAERMVEVLETPLPKYAVVARPAPVAPYAIRFSGIRFVYPGKRQALDGLDLEIRPGERLALVGESGAGKSTVVNMLLGFISADSGSLTVNGAPLAEIDLACWREQLAWVPQNPRLFHGTLLENIKLGRPDAGMDSIISAARAARADEFIERLPGGYETRVGEGGQGLSGGQIQRIALARAFLKNAPLVIMDEATASLDLESERLIHEALVELSAGRTLLLIAHRLATVRDANRILVMEAGRIVQQGSHEKLLTQPGPYGRMVAAYGGAG